MKIIKVTLRQSTNAISILYEIDGENKSFILSAERIVDLFEEDRERKKLCPECGTKLIDGHCPNEVLSFHPNTRNHIKSV